MSGAAPEAAPDTGPAEARQPLPARVETLVLGAGIAGLAYAHARGAAADLLVLEASDLPGGLVRTGHDRLPAEAGGGALHFEWGPEALQDNSTEALALLAELGLPPRAPTPAAARRYVVRAGRLAPLPDGPATFLKSPLLSTGGKLRAVSEPFRDARTALDGSVAAFTRHRFGEEVLARLVDPLVSGIYAGDPEQLSLRAAFPKVHELVSEHGSVLKALRAKQAARAEDEASQLPSLLSLDGGLGALPAALAQALGSRLRSQQRALAVHAPVAAEGWRVETAAGDVRARRLVCALPVGAAARLLLPAAPALGAALGSMTCESVVSLVHAWRRDAVGHPLDGFGYLVPSGEGRMHLGTLFSSSLWPARCPDGVVLLRTLLGGARQPALVGWPDEELLAVVQEDVAPLLALRGAPLYTSIVRHRAVLPRYDLAQPQRQERIDALLAALPGLELLGNYRRGISVIALIEAGRRLARAHAGESA